MCGRRIKIIIDIYTTLSQDAENAREMLMLAQAGIQ
jgi:hypothetical protein